jgi:simple sugar transport system permease protein
MFADILAAGLRFSTTINVAALGGSFTQKVGIWNVALEGLILSSAFSAVWISYTSGNAWLGLAGGAATGLAVALILAFVVVTLGADEIIAGLAVNLLASGATKYLLPIAFGGFQGAVVSEDIVPLPEMHVPGLDSVPLVGEPLNDHSPVVYGGLLLVPLVTFVLYRTGFGLAVRAVGDAPEAARAAGIHADRIRYAAFGLSGIFCGIAGAQLSLGFLSLFSQDMTSGVGYIAFAAVVFGDGYPPLVFLGAIVFGFAQAAVIQLGNTLTIPAEFISMVPYVVAIIALVVLSYRRRAHRLQPA